MSIASLASIAATTAAVALAEHVRLELRGKVIYSGKAVVSPDAAVDSSTGTPVIANTAYVLIAMAAWEASTDLSQPPAGSRLIQNPSQESPGPTWAVRAVLAEGGWWRLQAVKTLP